MTIGCLKYTLFNAVIIAWLQRHCNIELGVFENVEKKWSHLNINVWKVKGRGLDPQLHCSQCFALLICLAYWCFPFGELRVLSSPQTCTCVPSVTSVYICAQTVCFPWEDLESPYKGSSSLKKLKTKLRNTLMVIGRQGGLFPLLLLVYSGEKNSGWETQSLTDTLLCVAGQGLIPGSVTPHSKC